MSTQPVLRVACAASIVACLAAAAPAAAGNLVRFDASYAEPAPPADSPRACWRWNGGDKDWTWACRAGAYKAAYPDNPLTPPAPVRYDYPDSTPVTSGSSLSFVLEAAGRERGYRAHAD